MLEASRAVSVMAYVWGQRDMFLKQDGTASSPFQENESYISRCVIDKLGSQPVVIVSMPSSPAPVRT